ncbi:MAG: hypothetical protein QOJ27_733 [Sphingomonadales bacterium]|jgi:hypothetical protein|nr:hypothetical protein [Sphingomonadales bacterium]
MSFKMLRVLLGLSAAALLVPAAAAQEDPDTLVTATRQVDSGLALARRQIAATDLVGALGTLERVLFAHPEAVPPRLLYAALLCRLDDRQGAEIELGLLAGKRIDDPDWAGVAAACGPVPRPAAARRGKRQ